MRLNKGSVKEVVNFSALPSIFEPLKFIDKVVTFTGNVTCGALATIGANATKICTFGKFGKWGIWDEAFFEEEVWPTVTTPFERKYKGNSECLGVEVDFTGDYANEIVKQSSDNRKVTGSVDSIGFNTPTITIAFLVSPPEKDAEIFLMVK